MTARLLAALLVGLMLVEPACSNVRSDGTAANECGAEPPGFTRRTADEKGAALSYVIGGQGPAVVLLHGFPETWWTWRFVMPMLAKSHTVIAPDLRGVGCSPVGPGPYDADTLAEDVHGLVRSLGLSRVAVVGHDTGGWVAYAYARQHRDEVTHLALSGAAIPGFGLERLLDFRTPGQGLPHLPFFGQPRVPELLIGGREREYFSVFVNSPAMQQSGAVDFYARSYSRPGRLTAAFGQYRAIYTDAENNRRGGAALTIPTLAVSGGGEEEMTADSLHAVAPNVSTTDLPGSTHYVQEDNPAVFADAVLRFLQ